MGAASTRSNSSETIISSFIHNSVPAPEWGTLTPYTPHIIWSVHPPEVAGAATALTGVYGDVYGCTRGVSDPVYEQSDCQNYSYTPSNKYSDNYLPAIWSCCQWAPPDSQPDRHAAVSLS